MNKKALYGIIIAILLPLAGYLIVTTAGKDPVPMPRHFIYDSVVTRTVSGRQVSDTIWHRLPDFSLTNQLGRQVGWKDMEGKVVVAQFFFTHCPSICPRMTEHMKLLQDGISSGKKVGDQEAKFVQYLSFSVDPERDSVTALRNWATRFGIDPGNWWLLTGDKKTIYDMGIEHMKVGLEDGKGVDTSFFHTDLMVLIDRHRNIRGYYRGLDTSAIGRLSRDIVLVSLEKEPGKSKVFKGKGPLMIGVFLAAILGVVALMYFLKKDKN